MRILLSCVFVVAACGSSSSSNGADGGMQQQQNTPPPKVAACDGLAGIGVFEEITPPEVKAGFGKVMDGGGTFAIAVDPVNQGTIYVGTLRQKVWKSTDCGASWTHVTTGRNGASVDSGMNWTFAVDPVEPNAVYTNSGYGTSSGLAKSINGGVDWDYIWPPPSQPDLAKAFMYNFANVIAIDPTNHAHVLLTFHESCLPPHTKTCIAESTDAGGTWKLIDGEASWNGNEGQVIFFLESGTSWLWGSQTNGFWQSSNGGGSWTEIKGMTTSHLQGSQIVRTTTGAFVVAGADGVWRSADGKPGSWMLIPNTGPILGGMVADGATLYTSNCYFGGFCKTAKYMKSTDDGKSWSEIPSPNLAMGGTMGFDPGHALLYSSNLQSGLWRMRTH